MSAKPLSLSTAENGVWRHIQGEWRQLFGSFSREGVSIEYHNFSSEKELDWSRSFHADSLEICLNLQGTATLRTEGKGRETRIGVRSVAFYAPAQAQKFVATRTPGEHHHFVTVELSRAYLARRLGEAAEAAEGPVMAFLREKSSASAFVIARPMTLALQTIARAVAEPPVNARSAAGRMWYEAKVLELLSLLLFVPDAPEAEAKKEMFCDRQKRLTRERVEQACAILQRDLENPPSLEMLATQVGCGTFHLSRMFSQQVGQTVPQYLRQLRLERAAQLLREGRHNVTEAATAVGYSSLSHFSKAFWETYGCCPGLYGNAKLRETAPAAGIKKRAGKG